MNKHIKNETQMSKYQGHRIPIQTITYIDKNGFTVRKTIIHKNLINPITRMFR